MVSKKEYFAPTIQVVKLGTKENMFTEAFATGKMPDSAECDGEAGDESAEEGVSVVWDLID